MCANLTQHFFYFLCSSCCLFNAKCWKSHQSLRCFQSWHDRLIKICCCAAFLAPVQLLTLNFTVSVQSRKQLIEAIIVWLAQQPCFPCLLSESILRLETIKEPSSICLPLFPLHIPPFSKFSSFPPSSSNPVRCFIFFKPVWGYLSSFCLEKEFLNHLNPPLRLKPPPRPPQPPFSSPLPFSVWPTRKCEQETAVPSMSAHSLLSRCILGMVQCGWHCKSCCYSNQDRSELSITR